MARKHTILAVLLLSAAPAAASPDPGAPRKPAPDDQVSRELLELRSQLVQTGKEEARREMSRFRPLCDADGYPLVGNIANKPARYQPSHFCADVRKAGK